MSSKRPLKIWLLRDGETLPLDTDTKKMRTWRLGEALANKGHFVTWWSSNFFHIKKQKVCTGNKVLHLSENFKVHLIDSGLYKKNISLARIKHHYLLGKKFSELAPLEEEPDIIITSLPILEFPMRALEYAEPRNIPVIIDVRDMWPDIFSMYFPSFFRPFIRASFFYYDVKIKACLKKAQGIVSMSDDILKWALNKAKLERNDNKRVFYIGYDESLPDPKEPINELKYLPKNKVIYAYLGSFSKSNKVETIIEAARILDKDPDFKGHFIIAGDGENRKQIEERVKGLKNVTLLGWLSRSQSSYLMDFVDVSLISLTSCTSLFFPNKVFEALFYGKPIVFSLDGEGRKLLEENNAGIYFKAEDVSSLVSAFKEISEKDITQMKKNSKHLYNKHFCSDKIYKEYCNYIEKLYLKENKESSKIH